MDQREKLKFKIRFEINPYKKKAQLIQVWGLIVYQIFFYPTFVYHFFFKNKMTEINSLRWMETWKNSTIKHILMFSFKWEGLQHWHCYINSQRTYSKQKIHIGSLQLLIKNKFNQYVFLDRVTWDMNFYQKIV